jgi:hypothetical protein
MGTPAPGDPAAVAGPFEINPAHGMLVQCHHLRAALDAGEPRRACSALAIELGYLGQRGAPADRRALALSGRVEALAGRIGDPYVRGRATLDDAERADAAADMRLFATAIRLRKGELAGGSHGASLAAGARDALRDGGIADPDAMARLLCPFPPLR